MNKFRIFIFKFYFSNLLFYFFLVFFLFSTCFCWFPLLYTIFPLFFPQFPFYLLILHFHHQLFLIPFYSLVFFSPILSPHPVHLISTPLPLGDFPQGVFYLIRDILKFNVYCYCSGFQSKVGKRKTFFCKFEKNWHYFKILIEFFLKNVISIFTSLKFFSDNVFLKNLTA